MARVKTCIDRILPTEIMEPVVRAGPQAEAVFFFRKAWPNGSRLRVRFLGGSSAQRQLAMEQANWWTPHVNLSFVVSTDPDAELRIAFDPGDGAWSFLGTDCLGIPRNEPTMNLGFQDGGTSAHEFGHTLGLGHEHQNPEGGIEWNEAEVIRDLSGPPNNWTPAQIRHNVLEKYSADLVRGTRFDAQSIMLYFFPGTWTVSGVGTEANEVLSETDKAFAALMYPKQAPAPGPTRLEVGGAPVSASIGQPGEEDLFAFAVAQPGRHVIETGGGTDVMMKLFGPNSRTLLVAEDDDGGQGLNPRIAKRLVPGEYLVQIRHFNRQRGTGDYTIRATR
jgi:astacin (peptidase family M12A)